jgi:hypothetical protein
MKVSFACVISCLMPVVITARLSGKNQFNVEGAQQDNYSNSHYTDDNALINKELFLEEEADHYHYHDLNYQQKLDGRHLHPFVDLAAKTCEEACIVAPEELLVIQTQPRACATALKDATTTGTE